MNRKTTSLENYDLVTGEIVDFDDLFTRNGGERIWFDSRGEYIGYSQDRYTFITQDEIIRRIKILGNIYRARRNNKKN